MSARCGARVNDRLTSCFFLTNWARNRFLGVTGPRSTHMCFFKCQRFAPHVTLSLNQYKTDIDNKVDNKDNIIRIISLNQSLN